MNEIKEENQEEKTIIWSYEVNFSNNIDFSGLIILRRQALPALYKDKTIYAVEGEISIGEDTSSIQRFQLTFNRENRTYLICRRLTNPYGSTLGVHQLWKGSEDNGYIQGKVFDVVRGEGNFKIIISKNQPL